MMVLVSACYIGGAVLGFATLAHEADARGDLVGYWLGAGWCAVLVFCGVVSVLVLRR